MGMAIHPELFKSVTQKNIHILLSDAVTSQHFRKGLRMLLMALTPQGSFGFGILLMGGATLQYPVRQTLSLLIINKAVRVISLSWQEGGQAFLPSSFYIET